MSKRKSPYKSSKYQRLCGGPTLPSDAIAYWNGEMQRVADAEAMADCSFPTLLRRIARARLDLTLAGIARYIAVDGKRDSNTEPEPVGAAARN